MTYNERDDRTFLPGFIVWLAVILFLMYAFLHGGSNAGFHGYTIQYATDV